MSLAAKLPERLITGPSVTPTNILSGVSFGPSFANQSLRVRTAALGEVPLCDYRDYAPPDVVDWYFSIYEFLLLGHMVCDIP